MGQPVALAKGEKSTGLKSDRLVLSLPRTELSFPTAWLISPEGTHLLVADREHKLHRIRLADLTEEVALNVGVACHSLSWSKAGLLVSVGEGSILVMEPDLRRIAFLPASNDDCILKGAKPRIYNVATKEARPLPTHSLNFLDCKIARGGKHAVVQSVRQLRKSANHAHEKTP